MALKFIAKGRVGGSTTPTEDVVISTRGKKSYTISFNEDSLKTINSTLQLPVALMVAVTDSRIYFVPSNKKKQYGICGQFKRYKQTSNKNWQGSH